MADKAEDAELKSEAKESVKDAKSDNAATEDSKEDTKNGEKDENEESSEEEEHPGLYDKPVVIEGKRERKTTVFLANQTSSVVSPVPKPLTFEGKGESLGSMERTNYELGRSTAIELKPLHKLLYGRVGKATEIKKNIRKFNGFGFEKDSKEYEAKKWGVERFTNDGLKRLCEIFDLEKKGKRDELLEKVMDFLMEPKSSGRPAPQAKAKKSEKKKKRKRSKKDTSKSKSEKSKKTSETVESGDEGVGEDEEDEDEDEEKEEPPKKKKKTESSPKKTESPTKKAKTMKEKGKDKDKSKEKPKAKAKKSDDKTKASKKKEPVTVKITPLKKASPKKKTPKKEKPAPVEDDSSSDEEPLAKKTKKSEAPTDNELEKKVKDLLDGADLEQVTMKSVCKQIYDMYPGHDLTSRKDFIKDTVRKVIS